MEIWTAVWDAFNAPLFSLGADPVTPLSLVVLVLIFAVTWFVAGRVRWALEDQVGKRVEEIPEGVLHVIGNLARYTIIFMGWFIGLRSVGFQLDAVLVVFGALGVGMGFGLQNIANNFVSGVILLVERPIKVGDVVSVAGELGDRGARGYPRHHAAQVRPDPGHRAERRPDLQRGEQLDAGRPAGAGGLCGGRGLRPRTRGWWSA